MQNTYLKKINGQDGEGWTFMTGDSANIAKATKALGFGYKFENNEFMHEGALMMISPEGKITRYLKGISFQPFEFKLVCLRFYGFSFNFRYAIRRFNGVCFSL